MQMHGARYLTKSRNTEFNLRQTRTNSADPDQMPQNAASDQGLHCLATIHRFLHIATDCKIELLKHQEKYGKELRWPDI